MRPLRLTPLALITLTAGASLAATAPVPANQTGGEPTGQAGGVSTPTTQDPDIALFFQAISADGEVAEQALARIAADWRDSYAAMFVDLASLMPRAQPPSDAGPGPGGPSGAESTAGPPPAGPPTSGDPTGAGDPGGDPGSAAGARDGTFPVTPDRPRNLGSLVRSRLVRFLQESTGQSFGDDLRAWRKWLWKQPYEPHVQYPPFKGVVLGIVDERMRGFFPAGARSTIRLDEVVWGGVQIDGIPPLDHPATVTAAEADYLDDDDIVFGFVEDGEARAYPKRIIAWHEMVRDRVGDRELAIVYCTLCGTVIPYDAAVGGRILTFGTSGLLYRSNKLMYDRETMSLWSTVSGQPVIGELVGSGLRLRPEPVVTTRWGEWRAEHPDTRVLSIDTGYERDYSEGAAYREYFATDALMFDVPEIDERLANKDEVLAVLLPPADDPAAAPRPLAISANYLADNRLFELQFAGHDLVVITSAAGANRVFRSAGIDFERLDGNEVVDADGRRWRITEEELIVVDDPGARLQRVAARRAFWFGWYAQYPDTELIR